MDLKNTAFILSILTLVDVSVQQTVPRCLLSRLDLLPCLYLSPDIHRAGLNEYSVHYTTLVTSESGSIECHVSPRKQAIRLISTVSSRHFKVIQSPGFGISQKYYDNNLLAQYNVYCEEDEGAVYNIPFLDVQGANECHEDGEPRCMDYILIDSEAEERTEICGNFSKDNTTFVNSNAFTVIFRSSESYSFTQGFQMRIACLGQESSCDMQGCLDLNDFDTCWCKCTGDCGLQTDYNEPGVTVGLELSSYTVSESYGEVEICINAVGANPSCPNIQPFQVSLTANDESAISPPDYAAVCEVLTFAPCDSQRCVNVTIFNDMFTESEERLSLSLYETIDTPSYISLNQTAGSIVIVDDDSKESVFKVLSAHDLRNINLRQNPELLKVAARSGETIRIDVRAASQGAIIQEDVTAIIDCGSWLRNFPGGSVRWFKYRYRDLDHTELRPPTEQNPNLLNNARRPHMTITGDFYQIYTIFGGPISRNAEDGSRGIYECMVCVAVWTMFEDCHSANITIGNVGRPPIIDVGVGAKPVSISPDGYVEQYNIGSNICIDVDQSDPSNDRPVQIARLRCADKGRNEEENVPSVLPLPVVTWKHISLDGFTSAFFSINATADEIDDVSYTPPDEFIEGFPGLVASVSPFHVSTDSTLTASYLDFPTAGITRETSDSNYLNLKMAFGWWECTLSNSLGSQTETTFINDFCVTVRLEATSYNISESDEVAEICVSADIINSSPCSIIPPFQVSISTRDHIAVSPIDYQAVEEMMTFAPCESKHCVNVSITDDAVDEPDETFSVSLTRSSNTPAFVFLSSVTGEVVIADDDETPPPSDVEAVQDGPTSIRVTWRTSCEATGYRISYTRGGGVGGGSEDLDASFTSWKLTGLENGATYIISVVTISLYQQTSSPVTKHVTLIAPPVSPVVETSVLSATVPICLSWTLQPNLTGFQVSWELTDRTRRRAVYGTGGGTSGQLPEDQNSYTINALRSGGSYDVTVTVFNPAGNSSTTLTQSLTGGSGNECKSDELLSVTVVVLIGILAAVVLVAVIVQAMVIVFFMRKLRRERNPRNLGLELATRAPDQFQTTNNEAYNVVLPTRPAEVEYEELQDVSSPTSSQPPTAAASGEYETI